tara:strand:+ start:560 stop:760 length:201 start_codon:yes stop_codon:yes gene_type:complete
MIAKIEFQIDDLESKEDTRQALILLISEGLQDWLDGKELINIEFINDDETNRKDIFDTWISDSTIN